MAWGNSASYLLDRVLLLQKKAMRIISNVDFRHHTDHLFHSNNVLKIFDIYRLNLAVLMFQEHKRELPAAFNNIFTMNNEVHQYPTRQTNQYHLPRTRTALTQNTFIFTAPKFWNTLPIDIRDTNTFCLFKYKLKKLLIKQYKR